VLITALRDVGDHGDFSFSRLPNYPITKSHGSPRSSSPLPFRALPEHPRRQERNPENVCRVNAASGNSLENSFSVPSVNAQGHNVLLANGRKFVVETRHVASKNVTISRNLRDRPSTKRRRPEIMCPVRFRGAWFPKESRSEGQGPGGPPFVFPSTAKKDRVAHSFPEAGGWFSASAKGWEIKSARAERVSIGWNK
jgi:hypothetical protein